jgi:hypothetical protein
MPVSARYSTTRFAVSVQDVEKLAEIPSSMDMNRHIQLLRRRYALL